jgi:hypothetical protein
MWRPQRKTASHVLNIRGESYRLREKKQAGLLGVSLVPGPTTGPADEDAAIHPPGGGSVFNRRKWVTNTPALTKSAKPASDAALSAAMGAHARMFAKDP